LDYGLIQVPIAGLSPEEEPSSGQFAELKEYAKKIISIIFVYFVREMINLSFNYKNI
jgi:ABC-type Zn uptake system ZnuABC Zn-binding protein ZnuA